MINLNIIKKKIGHGLNARDLYLKLTEDRDSSNFSRWIERNLLCNETLIEGRDYIFLHNEVNKDLIHTIAVENPTVGISRGRPSKYPNIYITIDTAKHLCMLSKCKMGFKIREYFIQCEKKLKEVENLSKLNLPDFNTIDLIEESKDKNKISDLKKENKLLISEIERLQHFNSVLDFAINNNNFNPDSIKYTPIDIEGEYITPCLVLTDLHFGKLVLKDYTNGSNEYNKDIAEDRINYCVDKFIYHYKNMQNYAMNEVVIFILGDIIQNHLHNESIDMSIPEQVVFSARVLSNVILKIRTRLKVPIRVIFNSGNHDSYRNKNIPYGTNESPFNSSYLYIIKNMIESNLKEHKDIHYISNPFDEVLSCINGYNILSLHGHTLRVNVNLKRSIENVLDLKSKQIKSFNKHDKIDLLLLGHFHHPILTNHVIVGSSICGLDSFESKQLNLAYTNPGMTSFCITDNGKLSNYKIIECIM